MDLSVGYDKYIRSLRQVCEEGRQRGSKELIVAFGEFFRQYRNDTGMKESSRPIPMRTWITSGRKRFRETIWSWTLLSLLSP